MKHCFLVLVYSLAYVCATLNQETGECESWREIDDAPPPQQEQVPVYQPYSNDYRLPPGHARAPKQTMSAPGSSLLPGREYAPGFGTSHKPIFENK